MPATAFDLTRPAVIVSELDEANRLLARSAQTPARVIGLVEDLTDAIADGEDRELASVNPWLWIQVQRAALHAQAALRDDDPIRRRRLRLAIEQLRFLIARIVEREAIGEERPVAEVAHWLDAALGSVSQPKKAQLLQVSPRTYQRWISDREPTRPSGEDERRLRIVARLVNQLRHSLTGPGVVDWFEHPRADLEGRAPFDLLGDPSRLEPLITAAAASRGNVAA